jgi:hypothetical protein
MLLYLHALTCYKKHVIVLKASKCFSFRLPNSQNNMHAVIYSYLECSHNESSSPPVNPFISFLLITTDEYWNIG